MSNALLIKITMVQGTVAQVIDVYFSTKQADLSALLLMFESDPAIQSYSVFNALTIPFTPLSELDISGGISLKKLTENSN